MKVLFIGIGSIAKRHIKNLRELLGNDLEITALRSGTNKSLDSSIKDKLNYICYSTSKLQNHYDIIFITNPTSLHYETLLKFKDFSDNFFIVKPVFVTGLEDISTLLDKNKIYYVACPLRYTNVFQYLKNTIMISLLSIMM